MEAVTLETSSSESVRSLTCVMGDWVFDLGCRRCGGVPRTAQQGLDGGRRGAHQTVVRDALKQGVLVWADLRFLWKSLPWRHHKDIVKNRYGSLRLKCTLIRLHCHNADAYVRFFFFYFLSFFVHFVWHVSQHTSSITVLISLYLSN